MASLHDAFGISDFLKPITVNDTTINLSPISTKTSSRKKDSSRGFSTQNLNNVNDFNVESVREYARNKNEWDVMSC